MEIGRAEAVAALAACQPLGVPMLDGGEDPAVNTRTPSVPHMRFGMPPSWGAAKARASGGARMSRQTRSRAQTLGSPSQGDASRSASIATSSARSGLRSPTLCRRLLGVLAGGHGVEPGAPGGADEAVGQTRAGRGRHSSPDLRRSPSSSTCMVGFMAIQFRLHRMPLRCLSEASPPTLSHALLEPEDLYAQLARRHRSPKAANPHACAPPSIAGQVPAGLPAKPGLGKTWTSQARPQAHQQQLSSQNYRSCSGPPWTLRLSQFCVQGNRVRLNGA